MVDPAKLGMIDPLYLVVFTPILDNKNILTVLSSTMWSLGEKRNAMCTEKVHTAVHYSSCLELS